MNKRSLIVVSVAVASFFIQANTAMAKGSVVGKVGTLGAGLEYVHPLSDKLAVGFGVNGLSYDASVEESDIDFDADFKMQTFSLLADYHPFANGFRLSAGVMHNGNEFSLVGTPTGDEQVEIGDNSYDASEVGSLDGFLGFKSLAPYLGVGWGHAPRAGKGWAFDADLGVLFQGAPEASLTATCGTAFDGRPEECQALQDDVADEEASFKNDSEDFKYLPVISIGASYSF